jgi:hypothetical protein
MLLDDDPLPGRPDDRPLMLSSPGMQRGDRARDSLDDAFLPPM